MFVDTISGESSPDIFIYLKADSLDLVELIMDFEEEFSVEIPDEEAETLTSVETALDYINNRLN